MPARLRVVSGVSVSAGERTWRLPREARLLLLALVLVALVLMALFVLAVAVAAGPNGPQAVSGVALYAMAGLFLACLVLVWRRWLVRATLTADSLVIRNEFTTRVVPLANITEVVIVGGVLRVIEGGTAWPADPNAIGTRVTARRSGGVRHTVNAAWGGGPYSATPRTRTDEIADEIADAAGLPAPSPRQPAFSPRGTVAVIASGAVLVTAGLVLDALNAADHPSTFLAGIGNGCFVSGCAFLVMGIRAAANRRRSSRRRSRRW